MKDCTTCKYFCINYHVEFGKGVLTPGNYCTRKGLSYKNAILMKVPCENCSDYEEKEAEKLNDDSKKENPNTIVDWNQRRYELSKEFMSVIMGRLNYDPLSAYYNRCACGFSEDKNNYNNPYLSVAHLSADAADALIHILKEKE